MEFLILLLGGMLYAAIAIAMIFTLLLGVFIVFVCPIAIPVWLICKAWERSKT